MRSGARPYGVGGSLIVLCGVLALASAREAPEQGIRAPAVGAEKSAHKEVRPGVKPLTAPWDRPALALAGTIPLDSAGPSPAEAGRVVKGGRFVEGGWEPTDRLDRLVLELKDGFAAGRPGAIELDMTHLDFPAQVDGRKQHFFSLYSHPSGDHFTQPNNFFTLRGGNYNDEGGHRGIKVLWRGGGNRGEKAPFAAREDWDPAATYTWRAEWTDDELVVYLDGRRIFGPAEFKDRNPDMPLKYVFLSKDGCPNEKLWFGFVGPLYKTVRVYK